MEGAGELEGKISFRVVPEDGARAIDVGLHLWLSSNLFHHALLDFPTFPLTVSGLTTPRVLTSGEESPRTGETSRHNDSGRARTDG